MSTSGNGPMFQFIQSLNEALSASGWGAVPRLPKRAEDALKDAARMLDEMERSKGAAPGDLTACRLVYGGVNEICSLRKLATGVHNLTSALRDAQSPELAAWCNRTLGECQRQRKADMDGYEKAFNSAHADGKVVECRARLRDFESLVDSHDPQELTRLDALRAMMNSLDPESERAERRSIEDEARWLLYACQSDLDQNPERAYYDHVNVLGRETRLLDLELRSSRAPQEGQQAGVDTPLKELRRYVDRAKEWQLAIAQHPVLAQEGNAHMEKCEFRQALASFRAALSIAGPNVVAVVEKRCPHGCAELAQNLEAVVKTWDDVQAAVFKNEWTAAADKCTEALGQLHRGHPELVRRQGLWRRLAKLAVDLEAAAKQEGLKDRARQFKLLAGDAQDAWQDIGELDASERQWLEVTFRQALRNAVGTFVQGRDKEVQRRLREAPKLELNKRHESLVEVSEFYLQ